MGMVRFPLFAPWWEEAKAELLKFPNGLHDDFVDFLAHMGRGVDRMVQSERPKDKPKEFGVRTFGAYKKEMARQAGQLVPAFGGW
jgi:hypothetical protein